MFEVSTLSPSRGPRQNDLVHAGYYPIYHMSNIFAQSHFYEERGLFCLKILTSIPRISEGAALLRALPFPSTSSCHTIFRCSSFRPFAGILLHGSLVTVVVFFNSLAALFVILTIVSTSVH